MHLSDKLNRVQLGLVRVAESNWRRNKTVRRH